MVKQVSILRELSLDSGNSSVLSFDMVVSILHEEVIKHMAVVLIVTADFS